MTRRACFLLDGAPGALVPGGDRPAPTEAAAETVAPYRACVVWIVSRETLPGIFLLGQGVQDGLLQFPPLHQRGISLQSSLQIGVS